MCDMSKWEQQDVDAWKLVKQYVAEHGGQLPPKGEMYQDYPLGKWCACVREVYHYKEHIPRSCREGLESIPEWSWDQWRDFLEQLREYMAEFNEVPTRQTFYYGSTRLGWWCWEWRRLYREGELPQDRIDALETVPGWTW